MQDYLFTAVLVILVLVVVWYIWMDGSSPAPAKKEHAASPMGGILKPGSLGALLYQGGRENMINEAQIADIARGYNENRLLYDKDYYDAVVTLADAEHADKTSDIVLDTWGH